MTGARLQNPRALVDLEEPRYSQESGAVCFRTGPAEEIRCHVFSVAGYHGGERELEALGSDSDSFLLGGLNDLVCFPLGRHVALQHALEVPTLKQTLYME